MSSFTTTAAVTNGTALPRLTPEQRLAALLAKPALEPPPGVTPNFAQPGGVHGPACAFLIICAVLGFLSIVVRLYSRLVIVKRFGVEDGLFISALVRRSSFYISLPLLFVMMVYRNKLVLTF